MQTNKPAYKNLQAWQHAMDLVEEVYRATKSFPNEEKFGLTSQMRRAAVSMPSNVAEGFCRRRTRAYAHHVSIALGSQAELETCLELAGRLAYLTGAELNRVTQSIGTVGRLLSGLHRSLEDKLRQDQALGNRPRTPPS